MRKKIIAVICFIISINAKAQDTVKTKSLDSVSIYTLINQNIVKPLPAVQGTYLFLGKKTEVIEFAQLPADITNKTGRQIFSKIPGVFVYDMDGSGNQVNIAARGLDPHRGWEFNIRKDGVITNSDMYGYPASHYSMPMESISRVQLVRGTGSLQYGAQFGGMLNYISKQADSTKPFSFESINSAGSYNLVSTYNAVGGTAGKFSYYAYMYRKSRNGYRDNEHTDSHAESVVIAYAPSKKINVKLEWSRSAYTYKIPGPLTDSMFYADPTQATRSRNYFNPDIHVPSVTVNFIVSAQTKLQLTSSALLGKRNSVQFDKPTNVKDTINAATLQYNNRQVDVDAFHSYTTELRLLHNYNLGKQNNTLVAGVQYMNNNLHRTQLGKGTTGSDFDLTLVDTQWGRDLYFKTKNIALFAENKFQLTKKLSLTAGARVEAGKTNLSGTMSYYPLQNIPVSIDHHFPLLGVNALYKVNDNMEWYGGFCQAYRPMIFKDLIPASLFEKVDSNIKDAKGYNAELGFRGNWKFLRWDVNAFVLQYNNRFGTLAMTDAGGNFYTWRTNIGNSVTTGAEIFIQADFFKIDHWAFSLFTSTYIADAHYTSGAVKSGTQNIDIKNKKVEAAPSFISRNGTTFRYKKVSLSVLYSYTAKSYADPLNTITPLKSTGAVGLVPAYGIWDATLFAKITKQLDIKLSVNNFTNHQYFTKRPTFYPGPGIWPSDGRNATVTVGFRL